MEKAGVRCCPNVAVLSGWRMASICVGPARSYWSRFKDILRESTTDF